LRRISATDFADRGSGEKSRSSAPGQLYPHTRRQEAGAATHSTKTLRSVCLHFVRAGHR